MALTTWTGAGDGFYFQDPANWDTNAVPTVGDNVVIGVGASVVSDTFCEFDSLNLTGTLEFSGDTASTQSNINVGNAGDLKFSGIALFGGGAGIAVASGGRCEFLGGGGTTDSASITVAAGGTLIFTGSYSAATGTITVAGVCNFIGGGILSTNILVQSGGVCTFDASMSTFGGITVQSGGSLFWSSNANNLTNGAITVQGGGICNFYNTAQNNGAITFQSGAVGSFNDTSSNLGSITMNSGGLCIFSGGLQKGNVFGTGVIRFPTIADLMRQLNGSGGRSGNATNTQRPTNFGGGQL